MNTSAHAIVVGNEKGGTGKSTTAMHVIVSLLKDGFTVGAIDLDARQGTLSRYFANREATAHRRRMPLPMPERAAVMVSDDPEADREKLFAILGDFAPRLDYVVMDCPGHDNSLSRLAHNFADTLITPLNDSFVDLDNLADVDPETFDIRKPSRYAETVWEERKRRMLRDRGSVDWIVLRNRLSQLDAKNKRRVGEVLERLKDRIGFRSAPGLSERVIYRELFLDGLTLLDVIDAGKRPDGGVELSLSHVAARQELRALMDALELPAKPASGATEPVAAKAC
ncbi:division plane positioning ATPase MipZ [Minwuia sp.]|uniref:division plane positioning ATPase MipZ n=1 Tax=Minwuia sp. TaxID=2493630 RepID=UPI003A8D4323